MHRGPRIKSGYESFSRVNNTKGKEDVCTIADNGKKRPFKQLTDGEKKRCTAVNQTVGTARW